MPKFFFEDTGLVNLLVNKTLSLEVSGILLENSIYSELRKNLPVENLYFWRTNKKQEIDFVIDYLDKTKRKKISAIEVKNTFLNKHTTNLRYFKDEYNQAEIYICCFDVKDEPNDKEINLIYPWQTVKFLNKRDK